MPDFIAGTPKGKVMLGYNNLAVEYDYDEKIAFGWGIIYGDTQNAEWGYFSLIELFTSGMENDDWWEPCPFPIARDRAIGYLEPVGTVAHIRWYSHYHKPTIYPNWLEHRRHKESYEQFAEKVYRRQMGLENDDLR